jgi:dolichol-phosphate mannosyltransferase
VLENIDLTSVKSNGYAFQAEMSYRAHRRGHKLKEIPITFVDRRVGQSKMSPAIALEALWLVWKLRFSI